MDYNNKKVMVSVIYSSPNQNKNDFDLFLTNLEQLLGEINNHKPYLSIITGYFNARSSSWWSEDLLIRRASICFHLLHQTVFLN